MGRDRGIVFDANAEIAAVGNTDIVAAVAGQSVFVTNVVITVEVLGDGTGTISIDDGTNDIIGPILIKDGNGVVYPMDFGDRGISFGKGNAVRLVNATSNVTARATITGYKYS